MEFTLTVTPENSVQERALVNLGFERKWDNSPFTFETGSLSDALGMARQLGYDCSELDWTLEKVAH